MLAVFIIFPLFAFFYIPLDSRKVGVWCLQCPLESELAEGRPSLRRMEPNTPRKGGHAPLHPNALA